MNCCLAFLAALKIRKFQLSDLNDIMRIMQVALPDLYKNLANARVMSDVCYVFEKWSNRVSYCIRRGSIRFLFTDVYDKVILVAEYSGKIVGFIQGFPITDKEWLINAIAVSPNYRRKGIGQKLVKELISYLHHRGWKKIILYVKPNNAPAIRLYKKLGFKEVEHTKICMSLELLGRF